MDAAHGSATAALKPLNRGIREYSLFQGVLLVLDRLRQRRRLPETVDGLERRETNAQATGAWGNPASVLLRCGVPTPGPTASTTPAAS